MSGSNPLQMWPKYQPQFFHPVLPTNEFFFKKNMPLFCRLSIDPVEVLSPSGSAMYKVSGQAAIPQGFSRCLSRDLLSDLSNLQELPSTLSASPPLKYLSSKGSIKFLLHSKLLIYSNAQRHTCFESLGFRNRLV